MSMDNATNIMKNYNLNEKKDCYKFICEKWLRKFVIKKSRKTILNRANAFSKNNKEVLREKARTKYIELSKDKKDI